MKKLFSTVAIVVTLAASALPGVLARANDAGPLNSVAVSPATAVVAVNGTQQFNAVAEDAANQTVSNVTYNWSVVAGGGTINATSGLFTAGNETGTFNGTVLVTATQGNFSVTGLATVLVAVPGQLTSLTVSPSLALIPVSGNQQLTATAKDAFDQNATGVNITWSVVSGSGTVDNVSGLFTAGNASGTSVVQGTAVQGNITLTGNATISVAVPGQIVNLSVSPSTATVPVNGNRQFTAVAKDAFNNNATGVNLTWSVVAGGGSINSTSGLFTAGNATGTFNGTVKVTAVQGNITQTATADVVVAAHDVLDHVVISPSNTSVTVNGTKQFTAMGKDAFNNNVPNVTYTWSIISGSGSINATTGLFTASNVTGNTTIQVSAVQDNVTKTATAVVTVVAPAQGKHKNPPGFDKGNKNGWDGEDNPPGWDHGNKNGWNGQPTPPGLNKGQDNDEQGENAGHGNNPAPANPANNGNANHGNAGNTPAANNAANHGNSNKD